jgi:RNA polymerase sigma-70 factor, ECF subfamily
MDGKAELVGKAERTEQAELIGRAARGEERAYRALYGAYRPLVLRQLRAFPSLDRDELEDVVQDTFVRAFRALPRLEEARAFAPWLLSIARNRALSQVARRQGAARVEEELGREALDAHVPALPSALQVERSAQVVRQLISELLPGPERETAELFYVHGELSAREIAEQMGVGKSAVTMRLERFRARVKRELLRRLLAAGVE